MILYEVPNNSRIRIEGLTINGVLTEELNFYHIDGMYSYCTTDEGLVVHLGCGTEVEIVKNKENE